MWEQRLAIGRLRLIVARNQRAIAFYRAVGFEVEPGSAREREIGGATVQELRCVQRA